MTIATPSPTDNCPALAVLGPVLPSKYNQHMTRMCLGEKLRVEVPIMTLGYDPGSPVFVQFRAAADKRGIVLPLKINADGEIHRCPIKKHRDKKGRADGAYLLHLKGVVPAGGLQNHTDGLGWQN